MISYLYNSKKSTKKLLVLGNEFSKAAEYEINIQKSIVFLYIDKKLLDIKIFKISFIGTSLVVQWLRIRLPVQGTRVQAPVHEDPTCHGATKPVHHNYWACALEPVLHNKRSYCNEKPAHRNKE